MKHKVNDTARSLELKASKLEIEEQINNCATKMQLFEVSSAMEQYAKNYSLQRLEQLITDTQQSMRIELRDNYFNGAQIEGMIRTMSAKINESYVTNGVFELKFNQFAESNANELGASKKRLKELQSENKKAQAQLMNEIKKHAHQLEKKAEYSDIKAIREEFKKYAMYDELKELYNKVMPSLRGFEDKMIAMSSEYEQSKEMIRRYDEVILTKANKFSIQEIEDKMRSFICSDKFKQYQKEIQEQREQQNRENDNFKQTLNVITENIQMEIHSAVRKATQHLKQQIQPQTLQTERTNSTAIGSLGTGIGMDANDLRLVLLQKVDRQELEAFVQTKSNKSDMEHVSQCIDIMHKQITHIIVLFIEYIKQSLSSEGEKIRNKKKMFLLQQSVNVCKWVHSFDPENINSEDLVLPVELKQIQDHAKILVMEFPKLDQVAEKALKKFQLRDQSIQQLEVARPYMSSPKVIDQLSPAPSKYQEKDPYVIPSLQLEKYITQSLATTRNNNGKSRKVSDSPMRFFDSKQSDQVKQLLNTGKKRNQSIHRMMLSTLNNQTLMEAAEAHHKSYAGNSIDSSTIDKLERINQSMVFEAKTPLFQKTTLPYIKN